ncbi:hypothetical protein BDY19DRAFT_605006 [Irpex rosettiformis]|uniref:Uncharacterized protein n=1 Tax=Irpex rosettiformis TaxID=378272 RepID=A0ACB8TPG7_9APHY|nr:hypothetical protein BDY19DRAFT_605006 [Irpex rosettiformis]
MKIGQRGDMGAMLLAAATGTTNSEGNPHSRYTSLLDLATSSYKPKFPFSEGSVYATPKKISPGSAKAAEWARLGDFFSKLASGDHKSLYGEVPKTPRKNPNISRVERFQSQSPSPARPAQVDIVDIPKLLESIPLTRSISSESANSASTMSNETGTSETDSLDLSPRTSISSLPTSASCVDSTFPKTADDECDKAVRGRTSTRTSMGRFSKPRSQSLTVCVDPSTSYEPFIDPVAKEEKEKEVMGGEFTFKMMVHELYDDLDEFRDMVKRVLEDSKEKFRPLEKEKEDLAHSAAEGKSLASRLKEVDSKSRNRALSTLEGKGQMEMVQNVVERAVKKRRVRTEGFVVPSEDTRANPNAKIQSRPVESTTCLLSRRILPTVYSEGAGNSERSVPNGGVTGQAEAASRKVLEEELHITAVRSRGKRRLSA